MCLRNRGVCWVRFWLVAAIAVPVSRRGCHTKHLPCSAGKGISPCPRNNDVHQINHDFPWRRPLLKSTLQRTVRFGVKFVHLLAACSLWGYHFYSASEQFRFLAISAPESDIDHSYNPDHIYICLHTEAKWRSTRLLWMFCSQIVFSFFNPLDCFYAM